MNPRTTLVLTIAAIVLTGFAWWDAGRSEFHFQRDLDQPFRFPESAIVGLTIRTPELSARLERRGGFWQLVEPIEYPAEFTSVEAITHLTHELRVRGEGDARRGTGLDDAKLILGLEVTGRANEEIRFGDPHPTLPYIYAEISGEVVLVDPLLAEALSVLELGDLRRTAIVDIPALRAERLSITRGEERFTAVRREDRWMTTEPEVGDADTPRVIDALHALNSWGVHSFVEDSVTSDRVLAGYGLAPPRGRIEVEERNSGRTVTVRFGDPVELPEGGGAGVFLLIEETGSIVRATAALLARLPASAAEWESRRIVRVPERDIVEATILGDYRRATVTRDGRGGWRVIWAADGVPQSAESSLLVTMLESLRGATVESFLPLDDRNLQKYGFDRPALDLEVRREGGETERVIVGKEVEDSPGVRYVWNYRWARYATAVFPDFERWRRAPFSLRALQFVDVPPELVRRVRVSDAEREGVWVDGESGWQAVGTQAPPSSPELQSVLASLPGLRGEGWHANPTAPPGPRSFDLCLELLPLEPFDADPWLRLWVGPPIGTSRLVRVGDEGWVIEVAIPAAGDPFRALGAALE